MIHAPKSTFRKRPARSTSAITMTATVVTNAPTRWSLSAALPSVPNAEGANINQRPSTALTRRFQGTLTPQAAAGSICFVGAS